MTKEIGATARVRVLVEVPTSYWGETCTVAQIVKQAREEGINKVRKMVESGGGVVVGEPELIVAVGTRG